MANWTELQQEIATALGTTPDKLPKRTTPEWFALLEGLNATHPDLVLRARDAMTETVAAEPLQTEAEIASERRRAGVLATFLKWTQRPDPTQPPRKRTNRGTVLLVVAIAFVTLWMAFRAHTPTPPRHPAAFHPTQAAKPNSQQGGPTTNPSTGAPSTTSPGQSAPSGGTTAGTGRTGSTLPPVAQPPMPPYPSGTGQAGGGTGSGVTVAGGTSTGQTPGVQIVAPQAQDGGLTVVSGTAQTQTATNAQSNNGLQVVTAQEQSGAGQPGPGQTASGPSGQGGAEAAKAPSFQVGDTFTVKLLTPLAVSPAWQALPAVAIGVDGPLSGWRVLGSTSQGQDGSIQISWTQALAPDGKSTVSLHGVAYDPQEGKPGIPHAQTQVMTPQAAKTALSGTLQAVSTYVQDQIQSQQAIITNGGTYLTSSVPPFWQIAAQQLATGFQPAQVQTGGTIVVTRVPAGTSVVVFITATQ